MNTALITKSTCNSWVSNGGNRTQKHDLGGQSKGGKECHNNSENSGTLETKNMDKLAQRKGNTLLIPAPTNCHWLH